LESITLGLASCAISADALGALGGLKAAQRLERLRLVLGPRVTDGTFRALGDLAKAPRLQALTLVLHQCSLTAGGVAGLAVLTTSPVLTALTLDLSFSDVGDADLRALAQLQDRRSQRALALTVDLRGTLVGSAGLRALATLRRYRTFKILVGS
jgi:hypothetical protein